MRRSHCSPIFHISSHPFYSSIQRLTGTARTDDAIAAGLAAIRTGPHPYSRVVLPDQGVVAELESRGRVFRTDVDDAQCQANPAKIGLDADESPGGCSDVVVIISQAGSISTAYSGLFD